MDIYFIFYETAQKNVQREIWLKVLDKTVVVGSQFMAVDNLDLIAAN
jgi:hypothetical protein